MVIATKNSFIFASVEVFNTNVMLSLIYPDYSSIVDQVALLHENVQKNK